ncbi:F0F1 ATP synthase subunit B [Candidatus Saccharibacteria bacterium]|nr:F0F1 ATP synthase subunit B [Candidatus Saccharibacteria bacterium]
MFNVLTQFASTAEPEGIAALGIDPWAILAQGLTFLLLLFLIKKFALSKIVATLEERRTAIEGSLDKAQELQVQNEVAEKRVNGLLHEARLQAEDVITKSQEEATAIVKQAEDSAVVRSEKIVADGKIQIEQQVAKAQESLKKETLELVAQATTTLLGEKVDAKKNEELIKKALVDAGAKGSK